MKSNYIKCCECGRFCKPYDSGTYYGGYYDDEPPESEYFCKKCVDKELKTPERVIINCWWIKPDYIRVAKSILIHRKKLKE